MTTETTTTAPIIKPLTRAQENKRERDAQRIYLQNLLTPGTTVCTILRHCSKSGMMRVIDLVVIDRGEVERIGWRAAQAMNDAKSYDGQRQGIKVTGAGMDMGFHLVYNLSRTLYPDGFTLPEGKRGRNGNPSRHDDDGGYALNHRWL